MVDNNVAKRRHELGMTLEQLAQKSKIPLSSLGEIEQGREPGVTTAMAIAKALLTTVETLWSC